MGGTPSWFMGCLTLYTDLVTRRDFTLDNSIVELVGIGVREMSQPIPVTGALRVEIELGGWSATLLHYYHCASRDTHLVVVCMSLGDESVRAGLSARVHRLKWNIQRKASPASAQWIKHMIAGRFTSSSQLFLR